jgi:hypothetical protein
VSFGHRESKPEKREKGKEQKKGNIEERVGERETERTCHTLRTGTIGKWGKRKKRLVSILTPFAKAINQQEGECVGIDRQGMCLGKRELGQQRK